MAIQFVWGALFLFDLLDIGIWSLTGRGILDTLFNVYPEEIVIEMGSSFSAFLLYSTIPLTLILAIFAFGLWYAFRPIKDGSV